jgi:flagellar basal-body rod protein FlgB
MKILESQQNQILKRALNVYQKQHEAISKNIKNVNKQDYKRVNTNFTQELTTASSELQYNQKELRTSHTRHIDEGPPWESKIQGKGGDGIEVDLPLEMAELAENQIKYEFTTRMLSRLYKGISSSITGRV